MELTEKTPLDRLLSLDPREQRAFLAFFAGAQDYLYVSVSGDTGEEQVSFGKAECEWVPFREFWQRKLPELGLITFTESEPRPALGMVPGSTGTDVEIRVTEDGWLAREAWWERNRSLVE